MSQTTFVSVGSNTLIKTGPGRVYGTIVSGVDGASAFLVDSIGIGATPNYVTQLSNSSNVATIGPVTAAGGSFDLYGAWFQVGLTVATTSNANLTVVWD